MEKPIISIVVPTFNCASELKKTLESLKKQEYIGFECVIVDGNSTDYTVIVAEEYKNKVNFSITISVEKDKGIYDAMNKGVQLAQGKYIQFLGAGDTLVDSTTLKNVAEFCGKDKFDVIYGYVNIDGYAGRQLRIRLIFLHLLGTDQFVIRRYMPKMNC